MSDARSIASRLRQQRAQIEQRHLQFGRHCRLDLGRLLRAADRTSVGNVMAPVRTPECRHAPGPATLGDFVSRDQADAPFSREWVATLADRTAVVIDDACGRPSSVGIEKAVSIVQSRNYLEQRARRLLRPFAEADSVQLVTIDFASDARRHGCDFLMCFANQHARGVDARTSQVVKVSFGLPAPGAEHPVFAMTVVAANGFW